MRIPSRAQVCRHRTVDRRPQIREGLVGPFRRARAGSRHPAEPSQVLGEHLLERGDDTVGVRGGTPMGIRAAVGAAECETAEQPE
ncbi:hypothetical protein GT039_28015 [Streptomyces sp. SID2955]|nr:hypothetical protein [Streptomyces sp. SID2955]